MMNKAVFPCQKGEWRERTGEKAEEAEKETKENAEETETCEDRDQAPQGPDGHSQESECYLEGTQEPGKGFDRGSDRVYPRAAHTFILMPRSWSLIT